MDDTNLCVDYHSLSKPGALEQRDGLSQNEHFSSQETDWLMQDVKACEYIIYGSSGHLGTLGYYNKLNITAEMHCMQ